MSRCCINAQSSTVETQCIAEPIIFDTTNCDCRETLYDLKLVFITIYNNNNNNNNNNNAYKFTIHNIVSGLSL